MERSSTPLQLDHRRKVVRQRLAVHDGRERAAVLAIVNSEARSSYGAPLRARRVPIRPRTIRRRMGDTAAALAGRWISRFDAVFRRA